MCVYNIYILMYCTHTAHPLFMGRRTVGGTDGGWYGGLFSIGVPRFNPTKSVSS